MQLKTWFLGPLLLNWVLYKTVTHMITFAAFLNRTFYWWICIFIQTSSIGVIGVQFITLVRIMPGVRPSHMFRNLPTPLWTHYWASGSLIHNCMFQWTDICWYTPLGTYNTLQIVYVFNGPFAKYVKLRVVHAPGMPITFSPPQRVSDPDMHQGTCVTHVPWCIPGSLTSGFLWSWWRGKCSRHSQRMRNPQFFRIW